MKILNVLSGLSSGPLWQTIIVIGGISLIAGVIVFIGYLNFRIFKKHDCAYCTSDEAFGKSDEGKYICHTCDPNTLSKKQNTIVKVVFRVLYPVLIVLLVYVFTSDPYAGKEKVTVYFKSYKATGHYDTWSGCESVEIGINMALAKNPTAKIEFICPIAKSETDERIIGYIIGMTKDPDGKKVDNSGNVVFKEDSKTAQEMGISD
ncbi:MAG: hypothetical protein NT085_02145 [candidate division SR1 bacterium]|nr:hypothetical protein [candidate division SR1 bacterium]